MLQQAPGVARREYMQATMHDHVAMLNNNINNTSNAISHIHTNLASICKRLCLSPFRRPWSEQLLLLWLWLICAAAGCLERCQLLLCLL
jgi:hypothetical protein